MRAALGLVVAATLACGGDDAPVRWQVVEIGAMAHPRKAWGLPWDIGSDPDLRLTLSLDGQVIARCSGPDDAPIARCAVAADIDVDRAVRIDVLVVDRDVERDDRVGAAHGALTQPPTARTRVDLRPVGALDAAYAVIAPAPGPFAAHARALIGLGSGVAAGLLVAFGLRRRLVRDVEIPAPPVGPDELWGCAFCSAGNRGAQLRCHACGAAR